MDPSKGTSSPSRRRYLVGAALLAAGAIAAPLAFRAPGPAAEASTGPATPAAAIPVSVASVEPRQAHIWDEFSGRLEAVERVDVRSRVAGAVHALHFSEGELVQSGDLLVTIDPAPYAAEVQRAEAQVAAAQARVALTAGEYERGQRLFDTRTVSVRDLDSRLNAHHEAQANLKAAEAALRSARLSLGYTEVRAPVSGRVGRREITVGNLVAAGPGAAVLTTLVSVSPIYASFNADENSVLRALQGVAEGASGRGKLERIPVQMTSLTSGPATFTGRLQLIDNQVDAQSGTVRVRAVFDNRDGALMPGQFARLRMGQAKTETLLMVDERAVGTDQDKKFVLVVGPDNKALYRAVTLGPSVDGLRVVSGGLQPGERIVVNGLQRVRPGTVVQPQVVAMGARPGPLAASPPARVAQR
jgi:multidrug efflux system membrane fusion protein